jgi:hypothetical protein
MYIERYSDTRQWLQAQRDIIKQEPNVNVGFEVHTAVVIKRSIFWDMTLCSPLKVNRQLIHYVIITMRFALKHITLYHSNI